MVAGLKPSYLIAGGAVALALLYVSARSIGAAGIGRGIGQGAVDLVSGVLGGIAAAVPDGALNPADDRNIVYGGVNAIGGAIAGNKDWTLGGWIYEVTH